MNRIAAVAVLALTVACGSSTTPTTTTTTTPPATATRIINLSGNLVFGNVTFGSTPVMAFTASNTGNATLTFTNVDFTGGTGTAGLTASPTSGTIPAGGNVVITIKFSPTVAQAYFANVSIVGDQTSGNNLLGFSGTGVAPIVTTVASGVYAATAHFSHFVNFSTSTAGALTVTVSWGDPANTLWVGISASCTPDQYVADVCQFLYSNRLTVGVAQKVASGIQVPPGNYVLIIDSRGPTNETATYKIDLISQ